MHMHSLLIQNLPCYMDVGTPIPLPPLSFCLSDCVSRPACKSRPHITGGWQDFYLVCKHVEDVVMEWIYLLSYIFSVWFLCNLGISLYVRKGLVKSVYVVSIHWYVFVQDSLFSPYKMMAFLTIHLAIWKPKPLINRILFHVLTLSTSLWNLKTFHFWKKYIAETIQKFFGWPSP